MSTTIAKILWYSCWIACTPFLITATGCATPVQGLYPAPNPHSAETVYVVSHGWHTGIILEKAALPDSLIPEKHDFPDARYLEFGWGDADFYQTPDFSIGMALKAILLPTRSVLHVVGFSKPVEQYYADAPLVRIELSGQGFNRMSGLIHGYFEREEEIDKAAPLREGLYRGSRFYPARTRYHLFKTCNVWTARMLKEAGCPIVPIAAVSAANVMTQCSRFGEAVQQD